MDITLCQLKDSIQKASFFKEICEFLETLHQVLIIFDFLTRELLGLKQIQESLNANTAQEVRHTNYL